MSQSFAKIFIFINEQNTTGACAYAVSSDGVLLAERLDRYPMEAIRYLAVEHEPYHAIYGDSYQLVIIQVGDNPNRHPELVDAVNKLIASKPLALTPAALGEQTDDAVWEGGSGDEEDAGDGAHV
jgi:hypothetical protein